MLYIIYCILNVIYDIIYNIINLLSYFSGKSKNINISVFKNNLSFFLFFPLKLQHD